MTEPELLIEGFGKDQREDKRTLSRQRSGAVVKV